VIACIQNPGIPQKVRIRKPSNQSGDFHWTDWEFSLHKNTAGEVEGIICIGHDVTTPVKNEDLIGSQNEKLKNIAWQQSHELRSPVVNILGCIQIIRDSKKLLSAEEENVLFENIKTELGNLDDLIHKIVAVSKKNNDS
jgi:signal transduction histidine kinase